MLVVEPDPLKDPDLIRAPYLDHLRGLGYTVTQADSTESWHATHPERPTLQLRFFAEGVLHQLYAALKPTASEDRLGLLEMLNALHRLVIVSRFMVDDDSAFLMEAFCPGEYTEDSYSAFLTGWEADFGRLLGFPDAASYLN